MSRISQVYNKCIKKILNRIHLNNIIDVNSENKWLCPIRQDVQFCEEDIGCPMICDNQLIGIASQRYNWRTWAMKIDCGNLDVEFRYLFLNWKYVNWIKQIIGTNP